MHLGKSRKPMGQIFPETHFLFCFSFVSSLAISSYVCSCAEWACVIILPWQEVRIAALFPTSPLHPFTLSILLLVFTAELIFGECFTHQTKVYCGKQWIERNEEASKAWLQFVGDGSETEELLCAGSKQSLAHAPGIIFTILKLFFVFLAGGALFDSGVLWWFDYCWTVKDLLQFDR